MSKNYFLDHFCTSNLPMIPLYRVKRREGSQSTTFEHWVFRLPKVVQKYIFQRFVLYKSIWKLDFEWFWPKKSILGSKLTIWGWGSDLTPTAPNVLRQPKPTKKSVKEGSQWKLLKTKKRFKLLLKKSQKNSDQSKNQFFNRLCPKNGGQVWPPAPNRVKYQRDFRKPYNKSLPVELYLKSITRLSWITFWNFQIVNFYSISQLQISNWCKLWEILQKREYLQQKYVHC